MLAESVDLIFLTVKVKLYIFLSKNDLKVIEIARAKF